MKLWFIALQDLKLLKANKKELILHIIFPLLVVILVMTLFAGKPGLYGEAFFVSQDGGALATDYLNRIDEVKGLKVFLMEEEEAFNRLERGDILLLTIIPSDFSEKISEGDIPSLEIWKRGTGGQSGQLIISLLHSLLGEMLGEVHLSLMVKEHVQDSSFFQEDSRVESFMNSLFILSRQVPALEVVEGMNSPSQGSAAFFFPGVITLFIIFSLIFHSQSIVAERDEGILERMLASGLSKGEILGGKLLGRVLQGFLQMLVMSLPPLLIMGFFNFYSFLGTLVFSFFLAAAAGALGILIGSLSSRKEQALWAAVIISLVNSGLGNTFAIPTGGGPLVEFLNYATLSLYANEGLRSLIVEGASLKSLMPQMGLLLLGAMVFMALSFKFFNCARN